MQCTICGSKHNVDFYPRFGYTACDCCAKETPQKVSKKEFHRRYFLGEDVPQAVVNGFYEDYLYSKDTLDEYIKNTTVEA